MSMILMRTDLANDMRVIRLSDLTGAKVGAIIGGLHAVWSAAQTLSTDGFIRYMTAARIDRLTEVDGFAAAMVDVGWLKVTPDGAEFPDFDAYFGRSSKSRAIDRLRKSRDRKGKGKGGKPDKPWTQSGQNSDKTRTESGVVRAPTHDKGSERIGKDWNGSHSPPATPGGESESRDSSASTLSVPTVSPESSPPTPPPPASQNPGGTSGPSRGAIDPGASWRYSQRNESGPPGFVKFWDEYPKGRRTNKAGCLARWNGERPQESLELIADQILASLRRWKASWEAKRRAAKPGTDADYTVAPLRFLVETFWEATPEMPAGVTTADPAVDAEMERCWGIFVAMTEPERVSLLESCPRVRRFASKPLDAPGMKGAVAAAFAERRVAV